MQGKLILVGTPIGNLSDFSPRAIKTLEECDFILAEDTRVTIKLLNHFNIKKTMTSYFEHNKNEKNEFIINKLKNGETIALVSDAGMPAISDPGEELVNLCHKNNITVNAVPGPTALITALTLSGLSTKRFCFEGFLSMNKINRKQHLEELKNETRTMIFYEAPHKLLNTLILMKEILGDRNISLVREITKIYEEVNKTTFEQAIQKYSEKMPKGEFVLIIEGATKIKEEKLSLDDAVKLSVNLINNGESITNASKEAAKLSGYKKSDIYKEVLKNTKDNDIIE